jgi:AraC-like DNA-binding protein
MSAINQSAHCACAPDAQPDGLYRTTIAGPGRSLADAFANADQCPRVTRIQRHEPRDLVSARVTLKPEEGQGYWELIRIRSDLYVILSNFLYTNPRYEFVPGDGLVQFNFKVSGDLNYGVTRPGPLRFNRPSLHLWRQPVGVNIREWIAPSAHERMVSISARPEFLIEHFLGPTVKIPPRLHPFVSPPGTQIECCQLPLTAQMVEITTRLLENPYSGSLYLVHAEALTHQLLCAAINDFSSLPEPPSQQYNEREMQAVCAARKLLTEQFAPPPTSRSLARSVGLAEKVLASGFRTVYGETLFHFGLRCRMQYAMTLLRDRRWSVDSVSLAVGYAHPTSFATAFGRYFGMRPIDVKCLKDHPARDRKVVKL